jgi:hypothetical protein
MTDATLSAEIVPLHKAETAAERKRRLGRERSRAYRLRKTGETIGAEKSPPISRTPPIVSKTVNVTRTSPTSPITPIVTIKGGSVTSVTSVTVTVAALGLAAVGITMNGFYARSLGSTDVAGWLFLAIGVAADAVALVIPHCAASLWQRTRRASALAGWLVWLATFAFALQAGLGFASVSISDVTTARASRITPAVTQAETSLRDAMTSRDRECASGNGKVCRAREDQVITARSALSAAQATIAAQADPPTEAARRIVSWISRGTLEPSADDFAMLRLVLLALLPQAGGILLMIGRR